MARKPRPTTQTEPPADDKAIIHEPRRMGRLSMQGLDLEEALRGAMQVQPPEKPPKRPRKPKPPQKG